MLDQRQEVLAILSVLLLAACGSGKDGGGSHPPTAANLRLSSPAVVDGVTATAEVNGILDFTDAGGDVASLIVKTAGFMRTIPVSGASGVTLGTGSATLVLSLAAYGSISFEIWLVDMEGASSNRLSGSVTFVPDDLGTRWTQVSTLPAAAIVSAPGPGHSRYVAVGSGGLILTSQDGTLWTQQVSPVSSNLRAVAWSGTRFVAVGDGSTILTSEDGVQWTARASHAAGAALGSVSWGGGAFVAVGGDDYRPPIALRSPDGVAWSEGTIHTNFPRGYAPLYDVAWGAGRWVAVGDAPYSSDDGLTWTQAQGDYSECRSLAVGWNGARFLAVGTLESWLSADGASWSVGDHLNGGNYWGLAWSGYHWLETGIIGPDVKITRDGLSWTRQGWAPAGGVLRLVWDGDRFPARYLAAGGGIWTSP